MKLKTFFSLIALTLGVSSMSALAAETYEIDAVHSSVNFHVSHLQTSKAWGRFNEFSGTISLDHEDPSKSSLNFTVKANSVDTNSERRDQHLKGADFFDAKQFPDIEFKSTSVKKGEGNNFEVTGDLTLMGKTKSVTVTVEYLGDGSAQGKKIVGAEATFKIKRSDFGMNYGIPNVGDEVTLIVSVEAGQG